MAPIRVALVHDSLTQYGGAEKVLEELHDLFPEAPVFVPNIRRDVLPATFNTWDIRTTWLDRIPFSRRYHRVMVPLYPSAMHAIDLRGYELVVSSSFNFAHNVVVEPQARHVCYCHSPARFLWDYNAYAEREHFGYLKRLMIEPLLPSLRGLDRSAAQSVDVFVSTSRVVAQRIKKYYSRESVLLPPPVDLAAFAPVPSNSRSDDYFLMLMRLVRWKRPNIVVEACNKLKLPLVVAGDGRELAQLRSIAGPTVRFVGRVDGPAKADLYARCRAFILPAMEDFGITPLEAMASGRPVIAFGAGGAADTIEAGVTGEFFAEQTAASLVALLQRFDANHFDAEVIRAHAQRFDRSHFRRRFMEIIQDDIGSAHR